MDEESTEVFRAQSEVALARGNVLDGDVAGEEAEVVNVDFAHLALELGFRVY